VYSLLRLQNTVTAAPVAALFSAPEHVGVDAGRYSQSSSLYFVMLDRSAVRDIHCAHSFAYARLCTRLFTGAVVSHRSYLLLPQQLAQVHSF
jgi:hypothetical protein